MPSDDYASFSGGGALKLKGAKIGKNKKKKKDKASNLERSLSTAGGSGSGSETKPDPEKRAKSKAVDVVDDDNDDNGPGRAPGRDDEEEELADYKTEAERRHEEAQRKKFLKLSEGARPELLKTHKERVEELNTYLSKLSEHHDMPKIGPG